MLPQHTTYSNVVKAFPLYLEHACEETGNMETRRRMTAFKVNEAKTMNMLLTLPFFS